VNEFLHVLNNKRKQTLELLAHNLREHQLVYTGQMSGGEWVSDGLWKLWQSFFKRETYYKVVTDEGEVILPPETNEDGWLFLGGNEKRIVYLNPDFLEDDRFRPFLDWYEESGDTHLLTNVMRRPGKLAVMEGSIPLPERDYRPIHDGELITFAPEEWQRVLDMWDLPSDAKWAQVTIFNPFKGAISKGSIREVLPGETPAIYVEESWKFISDEYTHLEAMDMAVLTTDSVYRPNPSVNLQEFTYITKHGGEMAPWLMDAIDNHIHSILAGEYSNPSTAWGFLGSLGIPSPDDMLDEVVAGAQGSIMDTLKRWKLSDEHGWRGKVAPNMNLSDREVMLPSHTRRHVKLGDTVWVNRNPNLPEQGYVAYRVTGFTPGNYAMFNGDTSSTWTAWLGGDFDGDDGVILYRNPFTVETPIRDDIDLQSMKFTERQTGITVDACLKRYESEMKGNIGQWDMLGRYAINLGITDSDIMYEITKLIQLTISLKKSVGELEVPNTITDVMNAVKDIKELTPTYLLRNYRDMDEDTRRTMREDVINMPEQLDTLLDWVDDAMAQLPNTAKPRYTFSKLRNQAKTMDIPAEVQAIFDADAKEFHALIISKFNAWAGNDEDLETQKNREVKRFFQVVLPQRVAEMSDDTHRLWTWAALKRFPPKHLVYSAHLGVILDYLTTEFRTEKTMLIGDVSDYSEGDILTLESFSRTHGKLRFSRGILPLTEPTQATVTKVNRKSLVLALQAPASRGNGG